VHCTYCPVEYGIFNFTYAIIIYYPFFFIVTLNDLSHSFKVTNTI